MIIKRIFEDAKPRLTGKKVRNACIGLELTGVELDDGSVGIAYTLKNELKHGCAAIHQAGILAGMEAEQMGEWAVKANNVILTGLGMAVINAVTDKDSLYKLNNVNSLDAAEAVDVLSTDTVGMIGNIRPVAKEIEQKAKRVIIFDRGQGGDGIYPESLQEELLADCNLVIISSTTVINGSIEKILGYCKKARDIIMVGATTPLYPNAFRETGVTVLSGCIWNPQQSGEILRYVGEGASLRQILKFGSKISVKSGTLEALQSSGR